MKMYANEKSSAVLSIYPFSEIGFERAYSLSSLCFIFFSFSMAGWLWEVFLHHRWQIYQQGGFIRPLAANLWMRQCSDPFSPETLARPALTHIWPDPFIMRHFRIFLRTIFRDVLPCEMVGLLRHDLESPRACLPGRTYYFWHWRLGLDLFRRAQNG